MNELEAAAAETLGWTKAGVVAVHGPAAVVDTAVDVWASEHRGEFDVELSADLIPFRKRGGVDQYSLAAVFLQAIRGWAQPLPSTFGGRVAAYRAHADRRKVLLRLRNAYSPAQVRPWISGLPGSVVLVTSRRRLGGLITEQATFVGLADAGEAQPPDLPKGTIAHRPESQPKLTADGPPTSCRMPSPGTPCRGEVHRYAFVDALGLPVPGGPPPADLCEAHQAEQEDAYDAQWWSL